MNSKKDVYVYEYAGKSYINLTNRCTNDCEFCIRRNKTGVGVDLWIENEPTAAQVIEELASRRSRDVVFCGYGEPFLQKDVLIEVAKYVKAKGGHVRVDTNGHGNAIYGKNIVPEIVGLVDEISISLNAADEETYDKLCHGKFGLGSYEHMLLFARECVKAGIDTTLSVVDVIGESEIKRARKIAEDIGAKFRVREYMED